MGGLRKYIQCLFKRLPARVQILLRLWILGIAIQINLVAPRTKVRRGEEAGSGGDEVRREVDSGG